MLWTRCGGEGCLSLPRAAQGCWRRRLETKHDAWEAEGPSSEAKEKGSSHSGGGEGEEGDYASIGLHGIRQSPNSSGFSLRCNGINGLETSEAAVVRTRTDVSILSASRSQVSHRRRATRAVLTPRWRCCEEMRGTSCGPRRRPGWACLCWT